MTTMICFIELSNTSSSVIESEFLPLYKDLIHGLLASHYDYNKVQHTILNIHHFMQSHDFKKCIEHQKCWDQFINILSNDTLYKTSLLRGSGVALSMLQRIIQVISVRLPRVDILHSSLAWFPALAQSADTRVNVP